ncbi:MAG: MoaD/ThiS family protein [Chloroflexota bacterium]|nr:MoaD/ThiS family protein [Chloroflexota bacterium]
MQLDVSVPPMLRDCTQGRTRFCLPADTLDEGLQQLFETYPLLRVHLYDEREQLRKHVLMFFNGESIAWLNRLDIPVSTGDRLTILQAVSGG